MTALHLGMKSDDRHVESSHSRTQCLELRDLFIDFPTDLCPLSEFILSACVSQVHSALDNVSLEHRDLLMLRARRDIREHDIIQEIGDCSLSDERDD